LLSHTCLHLCVGVCVRVCVMFEALASFCVRVRVRMCVRAYVCVSRRATENGEIMYVHPQHLTCHSPPTDLAPRAPYVPAHVLISCVRACLFVGCFLWCAARLSSPRTPTRMPCTYIRHACDAQALSLPHACVCVCARMHAFMLPLVHPYVVMVTPWVCMLVASISIPPRLCLCLCLYLCVCVRVRVQPPQPVGRRRRQ
jgi:hypothetical protein